MVVVGPGSLYTSIMPNLLIPGIKEALAETAALRIYVCNAIASPARQTGILPATTCGQSCPFGREEHFDYMVVNQALISPVQTRMYAAKGAHPVRVDVKPWRHWAFRCTKEIC